jgi:hypothetical protein
MSVKRKVTLPVGRAATRGLLLGNTGRNFKWDVRRRASWLLGADLV